MIRCPVFVDSPFIETANCAIVQVRSGLRTARAISVPSGQENGVFMKRVIRTGESSRDRRKKLAALFVTTLSTFLTPFMAASVAVAVPSIGRELRMGPAAMSWVATSFLLGVGVFLVPMGRLADIVGRKKVFLYGIAIFAAVSLLCATARSAYALLVYRFFQGAGAAMTFGNGIAILTSASPPSERGKMLGINIGISYLGGSLGPFLGGLLTDHFGWRSIFLLAGPLGALIIAATVTMIREEWAEAGGEDFDYVGSAAFGLTLAAFIYGLTAMPSSRGLGALLLGLASVVFFVKWERRVRHPLLDLHLFTGNRLFAFSNVAGVVNYIATYSVAFLLSLYLQAIRGMSARDAGLLLVSQPLVQGVFTLCFGKLSDWIQPRLVASAGMALAAVTLLFFSFLSAETSLVSIVSVLALLGLSFALFAVPNANALMASVDSRAFGVASGMLVSTGTVGQLLSMGLTGLVFALYAGGAVVMNSGLPDQTVPLLQSMGLLFRIFTGVALLGVLVSFLRGNVRRDISSS